MAKVKIGILASHQGSNAQAVMDACKRGALQAQPCVLISNNKGSEALARAERENIPAYHLSSHTHPNPGQLDQAILQVLLDHEADLIILAGYMKKLGPFTLSEYRDRILNIHPALLPKHGGPGMYGRFVHESVLRSGEKETGVTIHLVDDAYDHGMIIAQCRLPVWEGDTVETLSARVLKKEHEFLVETLRRIIRGEIPLPKTSSPV